MKVKFIKLQDIKNIKWLTTSKVYMVEGDEGFIVEFDELGGGVLIKDEDDKTSVWMPKEYLKEIYKIGMEIDWFKKGDE